MTLFTYISRSKAVRNNFEEWMVRRIRRWQDELQAGRAAGRGHLRVSSNFYQLFDPDDGLASELAAELTADLIV